MIAKELIETDLIIQNNQVSVTHIETGKVIAGVFSIKNIFIYNKRCSSRVRCITTKNINYQLRIERKILVIYL